MNTKKIVSGILAAAFAVSVIPSATFADHGQDLSSKDLEISQKFVSKYSTYGMESRMKMNERISKILENISLENGNSTSEVEGANGGRVFISKSQRSRIIDVLNYIDIEIDSFDMNVDSAFSDATELNLKLQSLLKEHVNLSLDVLRNAYNGRSDFDESEAALDKNTVELAETIGSVYGSDAQAEFQKIWRDHIGFFAQHTTGLATNDQELIDLGKENLEQYSQDIADFFSGAIPLVMRDTIISGSSEHARLLLESMEAYDRGNYDRAYELQIEADTQIEGVANLLSKGIVDQYPNNFSDYNIVDQKMARTSKSSMLRLELNDLLREHVNVSLDVLRNAYTGSSDFNESEAALDKNTVELAETIGSVYGSDAQAAFLKIWRDHIGFFAQHTTGLAKNDEDLIALGEANLEQYRLDIAEFFSGAIPFVERETVTAGSGEHARLLLESMEAFDRGDYSAAYELQMQADNQIQGIADLLTKGITMQNPELFEASE